MAELSCDSAAVADTMQVSPLLLPRRDMSSVTFGAVAVLDPVDGGAWDNVTGLEDQQKRHLERLHSGGILWNHPEDCSGASSSPSSRSVVFRLVHGGEVDSDGNCLFTASIKAMGSTVDAQSLRRRTVKRFLDDFESAALTERVLIDDAVKHMYSPDLRSGWGVHVIQEVKFLAKKVDRIDFDSAIDELVDLGMGREMAAESIYRERCTAVDDGVSWAKYMSTSGSTGDEHDIITFLYTEEGLFSVDENRDGHAAAFGDDIAIQCLATEFQREIYVVQAHGSDAMVDEDNCVFFLPHRPRCQISDLPFFLFMKGTGWCGGGSDHYEPLIAHSYPPVAAEEVALVL